MSQRSVPRARGSQQVGPARVFGAISGAAGALACTEPSNDKQTRVR